MQARRKLHYQPNKKQIEMSTNKKNNEELTAIQKMKTNELEEEERMLNAEIEACRDRLSCVENELFYRKNPECRPTT